MSEITNKDLAMTFVTRFRAFKEGEVGVPTFTPEQLISMTTGMDANPTYMIQYLGDIGQHVAQILADEGEDAVIIVEAVISAQKIITSLVLSHLIIRTRPDIVAQLNATAHAEKQQEEFSWEEELKNLDFDMPDIGKLQLD